MIIQSVFMNSIKPETATSRQAKSRIEALRDSQQDQQSKNPKLTT